jgi:hypothetical protein
MTMFKGEPDWSTKQLLDEIKGEAVRGGNSGNLTYLMPAFAALLVKLSSAADARAKTMVILTWVLVVLTVAIAFLTAILLGHEFVK